LTPTRRSLCKSAIFAEYTPIIEPLSLDEAYLDVTANLKGIVSATQIAEDIRVRIRAETGLTASAGVSYNKFLAKLGSDHRKPDGLFVITPKMGPSYVEVLPVRKFHGVGPATARKMAVLGVETGLDLKGQSLDFLQQHFGKAGSYYYWAARGIDERPVRADRIRKSIGAENTFPADLLTYEAARDALRESVDKVWGYCEGSGIRGRTVTLKVKFANFQINTRSRTGQMQVRTRSELEQLANTLLEPLFPVTKGIRLLGISLRTRGRRGGTRARIQPAGLGPVLSVSQGARRRGRLIARACRLSELIGTGLQCSASQRSRATELLPGIRRIPGARAITSAAESRTPPRRRRA